MRKPRRPSERDGNSTASNTTASSRDDIQQSHSRQRANDTATACSVKPLNEREILEIFTAFAKACPHPQGELEYTSPFTLLVAVVLSAQATDTGVNKATRTLFQEADTPQKMLELGEEKLKEIIRTIGLYRTKAKNVILLSQQLIEHHNGTVPKTCDELERLAGVGRKTANVVLNIAFHHPTIAVDTHVFRVSNRTGLASGKTPLEVELQLERKIPDQFKLHAHHWLILHGRYVCKARTPDCPRCLIRQQCHWPQKTPV